MGKRITDNTADAAINIKIPSKLKIEVDTHADKLGISTAEFVRRALQEKIERGLNPTVEPGEAEQREVIRKMIIEELDKIEKIETGKQSDAARLSID